MAGAWKLAFMCWRKKKLDAFRKFEVNVYDNTYELVDTDHYVWNQLLGEIMAAKTRHYRLVYFRSKDVSLALRCSEMEPAKPLVIFRLIPCLSG